jgi:hypothetical protein
MGSPGHPKPTKLFVALLLSPLLPQAQVEAALAELGGPLEAVSEPMPWEVSRYYEAEMGGGLVRRFFSFAPLISPDSLRDLKLRANELEREFALLRGAERARRVNIDPGYLEESKVVLASTKNAAHRVYLGGGIYAEATLHFYRGSYRPLAHTYPDYRWPETIAFFNALRASYLRQLRKAASETAHC